jgi:hypothetical protein
MSKVKLNGKWIDFDVPYQLSKSIMTVSEITCSCCGLTAKIEKERNSIPEYKFYEKGWRLNKDKESLCKKCANQEKILQRLKDGEKVKIKILENAVHSNCHWYCPCVGKKYLVTFNKKTGCFVSEKGYLVLRNHAEIIK